MVVEASVTGIIRTVLVIVGVITLLRFFGRIMIARRAYEEEQRNNKIRQQLEKEKAFKKKNFGKVSFLNTKNNSSSVSSHIDAEDVDFEDVN
jgi:hypothetical protein